MPPLGSQLSRFLQAHGEVRGGHQREARLLPARGRGQGSRRQGGEGVVVVPQCTCAKGEPEAGAGIAHMQHHTCYTTGGCARYSLALTVLQCSRLFGEAVRNAACVCVTKPQPAPLPRSSCAAFCHLGTYQPLRCAAGAVVGTCWLEGWLQGLAAAGRAPGPRALPSLGRGSTALIPAPVYPRRPSSRGVGWVVGWGGWVSGTPGPLPPSPDGAHQHCKSWQEPWPADPQPSPLPVLHQGHGEAGHLLSVAAGLAHHVVVLE